MKTLAIELKGERELGWMREAGAVTAEVLQILKAAAAPGITTAELDRIAENEIVKRKAKPAFKGYRGFPATVCISINDEIVHGIPSKKRKLDDGDVVSLDLGAIVRGYYGDAALSVAIGAVPAQVKKLMEVTRRSLEAGIDALRPGARVGDVSAAVQAVIEPFGFGIVRDFVGHGVGRALHEEPPVPNYGKAGTGPRLSAGAVIAIEPMVTLGTDEVKLMPDGWTAVTADGSPAAHYEHTAAVTKDGVEILTKI